MHSCTPGKAPIVKGDKLSKAQCPQNDEERRHMKIVPYSSIVGSLMYAQVCTRLDIALAVGVLGRYLSDPSTSHLQAAKKVLRYLQGTKDHMLTYRWTNNLDIVGFYDANFGGCVDDKKSTTGYIFMMAGGAAEHMACYEATCNAMWLQNFILALGVIDFAKRPLKLYCDNSAVVSFSRNTRSTFRSKHIDVKLYFV
ncbi:hypothetical protein UlMin_036424 [Ulmus minor]